MIVEEYNNNQEPKTSIPKGKTISFIVNTIKEVPEYFISALDNSKLIKPLNENKLTQILVEQINAVLFDKNVSISAENQYSDLFFGTKGIPDFYFHAIEKGKTNEPLFVVESKILPAPPPKNRKTEYVLGDNKNGGIERFKIEKHGKGLNECGIVGFIKQEGFEFWKNKVNDWIDNLAKDDIFWSSDEMLKVDKISTHYSFLQSIAHREIDDIFIYHFWIKI